MGEWKGIDRLAGKLHESDYWQRELRRELEPLLKECRQVCLTCEHAQLESLIEKWLKG